MGIDGPFRLLFDGHWVETRFAVIPANTPHQLDATRHRIAFGLLDSSWDFVEKLNEVRHFDEAIDLDACLQDLETVEDSQRLLKLIVAPFAQVRQSPNKIDKRIKLVLAALENLDERQISADEFAHMVELSKSRFLHLFTKNVGLPFRRYVLWQRIINAVDEVRLGHDLTASAHAGGFADSAHFSRTFRETFGLSPSKLFKNSQFIQVIT